MPLGHLEQRVAIVERFHEIQAGHLGADDQSLHPSPALYQRYRQPLPASQDRRHCPPRCNIPPRVRWGGLKMAGLEPVIIIHGTYAKDLKWYRRGSDFCRRLDDQPRLRGSRAKCWADLAPDEEEFSWSGANSETERLFASL